MALSENLIKRAMLSSDLWLQQKISVVAASVMNLAMHKLTNTDGTDWYDCHRIDPLQVKQYTDKLVTLIKMDDI